MAAPHEGMARVAPGLLTSIVLAGVIDLFILRVRNGGWEFPSGAVLTAMIVAMLLSPFGAWYAAAITSAVAVVSKYVFRTRFANVFNPAALALVVSYYLFDTGQSWWGALPELPMPTLAALFVTGIFIADRVNKLPMVLAFLGLYYALFTISAFAGNPAHVVEIFRAPDLHAALYFAFFILTDPPTSPAKYPHQIVYAVIVAVTSYAVFELLGAVYYLLAGVLLGNLWEALRRWRAARARDLVADTK
jgi:Na+-translocating ferredoxin:NAD+ oxidoreductase RnfD subunit